MGFEQMIKLAVIAAVVLLFIVLLCVGYVKAPPDMAYIISGFKKKSKIVIDKLKEKNIDNILALRGDIPKDNAFPLPNQYRYACELIEDIKQQGDFCIGAACYPEGHVETEHKKDDISNLKTKVGCGEISYILYVKE